MLRALFGESYARDFGIALWEGTRIRGLREECFVLRVASAGSLRAAFSPPFEISAGRAFGAGLLDVEGDLELAVDAIYRAGASLRTLAKVRVAQLLRRLPRVALPRLREARLRGRIHSRARDRAAIGFHYDQQIGRASCRERV